jgi:hypothetical protein
MLADGVTGCDRYHAWDPDPYEDNPDDYEPDDYVDEYGDEDDDSIDYYDDGEDDEHGYGEREYY